MDSKFYLPRFILSHLNKILIAVIAFQMLSCNIINPDEPIPAYVHLDSISFTAGSGQGTSSSKIVDAWVSLDGTLIGAFEMPVTFPVLAAGSHKLTIRPGILINGIAATRTPYPFYTGYDTIINFESKVIVHPIAKVTYVSAVGFRQLENFDSTGTSLKKYSGSDTTINVTEDQYSFEHKYGAVHLDPAHPYFICTTVDSFPLALGAPAYIELNYMCNNEFTVGLLTYGASNIISDDIVTFNPSDSWRKEYVNLTPILNVGNAIAYRIYIKATKRSDIDNTYLFLDNIKVVH